MKILHVVTVHTPAGAFGGPMRVAVNQARALRDLGHEVQLIAGHRGFGPDTPRQIDGVDVRLFPSTTLGRRWGFAGYSSARMRRWLRKNVKRFDVVHVHVARDLTTLPAAGISIRSKVPTVLQSHGMIDRSRRWTAKVIDVLMTRRVFSGARTHFFLTDQERAELLAVGAQEHKLRKLRNGVPVAPRASKTSDQTDMLFMARLHPRKRPLTFARSASALADIGGCTFSLVGPDEGELEAVLAYLKEHPLAQVHYEGALAPERTLERLSRASVLVLPSVDEPFPMTVLEALSVGVPVVITDSCGLASEVTDLGCGLVVGPTQDALDGALRKLALDSALRARLAKAAERAAAEHFSMSAVIRDLLNGYEQAVAGSNPRQFRKAEHARN